MHTLGVCLNYFSTCVYIAIQLYLVTLKLYLNAHLKCKRLQSFLKKKKITQKHTYQKEKKRKKHTCTFLNPI